MWHRGGERTNRKEGAGAFWEINPSVTGMPVGDWWQEAGENRSRLQVPCFKSKNRKSEVVKDERAIVLRT